MTFSTTVTIMTMGMMMVVLLLIITMMMMIVSVEARLLQQVRSHVHIPDQPERQKQHDGECDVWDRCMMMNGWLYGLMDSWLCVWVGGGCGGGWNKAGGDR